MEKLRPSAPRLVRLIHYLILTLLYLPLVIMIIGAIYIQDEMNQRIFSMKWFFEVVQDEQLMMALFRSIEIALISSFCAVFLGTTAALAIYRGNGYFKSCIKQMSNLSLLFPEIVFALSLLAWFFVAQFSMGMMTIIIAHITFSISYVLMTISARLSQFDPLVIEAGKDLGANEFQLLIRIILPWLLPSIFGGFILSFLLSFDDFIITFYVSGSGSDTLPIKLYSAMKMGVSPKLNALSSLMFILTTSLLLILLKTPVLDSLLGKKK